MAPDFLSNIELYYSPPESINNDAIDITGDEAKHIINVMRHKIGEKIYVTDGVGNIYQTNITNIDKELIRLSITSTSSHHNVLENITFCLPRLKSSDRFEFALEKSIELGISNFLVIPTKRDVTKGTKIDRWNKIAVSAMKQSIRSYRPKIEVLTKYTDLNKFSGSKIIFEQKSKISIQDYIGQDKLINKKVYFIFGPEGGLTDEEIDVIDNAVKLRLTTNRLRSETAIATAASILSIYFKS
ncbi:MAG: 16S rRNA (uracil(1498)-N(3))-methyltransferase [Melioribacteraceae bacterium]|nr:16S rRNA (uracil(1498)-N(3))-methyltransferase [Melioribacteraceae bacterium]MCF8393443.1 16S rRNA (uracil(1498)-N(3))-methyltransferase [Melioribacteraceae bacterium]MCF8417354.1 16S rRNA (uracil(1498)-N(3))-methyltransferase [Melioribacteraceae bacterium]